MAHRPFCAIQCASKSSTVQPVLARFRARFFSGFSEVHFLTLARLFTGWRLGAFEDGIMNITAHDQELQPLLFRYLYYKFCTRTWTWNRSPTSWIMLSI